jgi:asparagine synthase (glutamine-hydrolysing)
MVWNEPAGDVVLSFNGEIYNYRELKAECDASAVRQRGLVIPWRGTSDTEVILWAYLLWGDDMLAVLDGMFALAIWDGRSGKMMVARDQFGVKPLYYSLNGRRFAFASELKALPVMGELQRTIDPVAVAQYVTFLFTPGERTMLESVRKLPAGHKLTVSADGISAMAVFQASFPVRAPDVSLTPETAARRLRTLLEAAVRRQMVSDVPVGAFLSGGLDSSALVNFARAGGQKGRLQCFTIGHVGADSAAGGFVADLPYAQKVAAHLGVDLHTVWVGPEMARHFAWMVGQLDEPQADPAALNVHFICKLAREQGIKVLLSGAGGDDIFSGYRRHSALIHERLWAWLPPTIRRPLRQTAQRVDQGGPWGRRFAKAFQFADATTRERLVGYFRWLPPAMVGALLSREVREALAGRDPAEPMTAALAAMPERTAPLSQMLHLDSRFFLADHNLSYTDKMSMAAGVEVRVPFMDPELVAFASSLPSHFKQNGSVGKWIFKKAMEPYLPKEVIYRPKTGFGVPLRSWLQKELRAEVDEILSEATIRRRGLFDPAGVRQLLERDRSGKIDATYAIFALMCVEIWCRKFVDEPVQ